MKGYKWVTNKNKSLHGNIKWKKGEWKKHEGEIIICKSGLHACKTALESLRYIYGDNWWEVEYKKDIQHHAGDKFVCREMRLVKKLPAKKILVEFAITCVRDCLKSFTGAFPDDIPLKAIKAAEAYVKSPCKKTKLAVMSAERSLWAPTGSTINLNTLLSTKLKAILALSATRSAVELVATSELSAKSTASLATLAVEQSLRSAGVETIKRQERKLKQIIKKHTGEKK